MREGSVLVPYQPLAGQKLMCFRIVYSGAKELKDWNEVLDLFVKQGDDL